MSCTPTPSRRTRRRRSRPTDRATLTHPPISNAAGMCRCGPTCRTSGGAAGNRKRQAGRHGEHAGARHLWRRRAEAQRHRDVDRRRLLVRVVEPQAGFHVALRWAATVRIAGRLIVQQAAIAPQAAVTASDLVMYIAAPTRTPSRPSTSGHHRPSAPTSTPNGTVSLGNNSTFTGAAIGARIEVGSDVAVAHDSAFFLP